MFPRIRRNGRLGGRDHGDVGRSGRRTLTPLVLCLLSMPLGLEIDAQIKASESATVSQTVDGTVITVEYARPRARGRDNLFGGVVHWDEVWTPGANDATVLDVGKDVEIDGHAVPAGRWSVWMVVKEEGPWELVLDPRDDLWHTVHPEPTEDQIRFPVEAEPASGTGTLLWYFPEVRNDGATLTMAWGEVAVTLDIEVEPTYRYTVTPEEAEPFLGAWTMTRVGGDNDGPEQGMTIYHHEDGSLRSELEGVDGGAGTEWVLQPKAEGVFALGYTHNGELVSNFEIFLEMTYEDGEPMGFSIRNPEDKLIFKGRRNR